MTVNLGAMKRLLEPGLRMWMNGEEPPEAPFVYPDPLLPGQTWAEYYDYSKGMMPRVGWGELSPEMKAYDARASTTPLSLMA